MIFSVPFDCTQGQAVVDTNFDVGSWVRYDINGVPYSVSHAFLIIVL